MEDLKYFIYVAALFHLRQRKDKAVEEWKLFWALWNELGNPPLPCTAPWMQK